MADITIVNGVIINQQTSLGGTILHGNSPHPSFSHVFFHASTDSRHNEDYITERVAHFLGIDLAELDPDGTGEEGGMRLGHGDGSIPITLWLFVT